MSLGAWMFTALLVVTLLAAAACAVFWKVAWEDGREAGILHERNTRNQRKLVAERREETDWDIWMRQLKEPGEEEFERLAATGELQLLAAPVTDTGVLRALTQSTDDYLEQMAAEEEAYRRGITS